MQPSTLRSSRWLAQRLGLSITTVERLRASGSPDLPPAVTIGRSIRYDENLVEQWLQERAIGAIKATITSSSEGGAA